MSVLNVPPLKADSRWRSYQSEHEILKSRSKLDGFLMPQLQELGVHTVLEVGCGSGVLPILLRERGYTAYGVDPDFAPHVNDEYPFLFVGAGQRLPFSDQFVELTYSLEVIEHVGTTDGMLDLADDFKQQRQEFVADLCRVTSRYVLITTPNKCFPIDEHATDRHGQHGFRVHSPFERNTLSVSELEQFFHNSGFALHSFVNPTGYYQLERIRRKLGALAVVVCNFLLRLTQNEILGRTPLNPHLFLLFSRYIPRP